jgi:hypothetical protein
MAFYLQLHFAVRHAHMRIDRHQAAAPFIPERRSPGMKPCFRLNLKPAPAPAPAFRNKGVLSRARCLTICLLKYPHLGSQLAMLAKSLAIDNEVIDIRRASVPYLQL